MKNQFGLCLWTLGNLLSFEEKLEISKEIGVKGVELEGDITQDPQEVKEMLVKHNLMPLSVTPNNVDISSVNAEERAKNINYYLELIDWAAEVEVNRICLHGDVGKVASDDYERDWHYLVEATKKIVNYALTKNIEVVFEVLNRYENYQVVNHREALKLIDEVSLPNLKILLDSYHMNIEESSTTEAIHNSKEYLSVYHVADSNRQAIGDGHANIFRQLDALKAINFEGPIVMEMCAVGPNPFTPIKDGDFVNELIELYKQSLKILEDY